jgi:hypothetical protein
MLNSFLEWLDTIIFGVAGLAALNLKVGMLLKKIQSGLTHTRIFVHSR